MLNLEAEVAKVELGSSKAAGTAVSMLAEPAAVGGEVELFGVCELPLLNPAARDDFDRLSEVVFASLRRNFRQQSGLPVFESSLSEVNGVLQSQDYYDSSLLEQLNTCVAVRDGKKFFVSAGGKVSVLLLRHGEWMRVVDSEDVNKKSGLKKEKIFSSLSTGNLQVGDCLVLSTSELLNYISLDRLKAVLSAKVWKAAGQELASSLEDVAGPGIAFGVLLIRFVDHLDPVATVEETAGSKEVADFSALSIKGKIGSLPSVIYGFVKRFFARLSALDFLSRFRPQSVSLLKMAGSTGKIVAARTLQNSSKVLLSGGKQLGGMWRVSSRKGKIISLVVILCLAGLGFGYFLYSKSQQKKQLEVQAQVESLTALEGVMAEAASRHIYGDDDLARGLLQDVQSKLDALPESVKEAQKDRVRVLQEQYQDLNNKLSKILSSQVYQVATLSKSDRLLFLPNILMTALDGVLTRYNLTTSAITEQSTELKQSVLGYTLLDGNGKSAVYDGDSLTLWQNAERALSQPFFQQLPKAVDFGGMAYFSNNKRLYVADNAKKQIFSFEVGDASVGKPTLWNKTSLPDRVSGVAIDGSLYVVSTDGLHKFFQGVEAKGYGSKINSLGIGERARIFASPDSPTIFIMDPSNQRFVLVNKKDGSLLGILKASEVQGAQDFWVDLATGSIYFLAQGSVYKMSWQVPK